jgi:hypothetical protein
MSNVARLDLKTPTGHPLPVILISLKTMRISNCTRYFSKHQREPWDENPALIPPQIIRSLGVGDFGDDADWRDPIPFIFAQPN